MQKQFFSSIDALLQQPAIGWLADRLFEGADKVTDR